MQERGYPRLTVDVDLIVPDVPAAIEKLALNGFRQNPGSRMTVTDRETNVEVDLAPGGLLPVPTVVSAEPQVLTTEKLISAKLSTYIGRGIARSQDQADVVELIKANHLARDFGVEPEVRAQYLSIWDALNS